MLYRFDDIEKSYGPHDILRGVTWQHNPGERVGLVGRNGAGKTTLFRLLLGLEEPDHGRIIRANGLTVGHLGQHLNAPDGTTLFDLVLSAFQQVLAIEHRMRQIEHQLAEEGSDGEHEALLDKYAQLQHEYEHANGYTIHSEVERVLTGLGFVREDWDRPIARFSGGQQNRAMLARLLLSGADVLLLDEPTNHLDLRGIEFLEEFLGTFKGSYLLISHDRTFLNRTVDRIVELAHGKLIEYPGNYERFVQLRAERHEQMAVEYERQQELVERTEDFIRRNIAGQKTKQAQSRRKMLAKLDQVERPETDETLARFRLDAGPRSGSTALAIERLTAGYEKKPIVSDFSLTIRRGERYAIMGPNGSGKSTLLKTLAGRLFPIAGDVRVGHNVQIGYYDQTLGDLSPEGKVIDEIWNLDHSQTEQDVRDYLARFSFFDDDVFKKVRALSGGEKGRLALAKIMYVGGNVMLLDEPTNHLDVYTREALEDALEGFTGALVVVSHDRYFVDRVAEHVIIVEEGGADVHAGNYSEVVERFRREAAVISEKKTGAAAKPKPSEIGRDEQKRRDRRLRKIDEEISGIETKVTELESRRQANDALLCQEDVYTDGERVRSIQSENSAIDREIETLYASWGALSSEREALAPEVETRE
ncbi:MAG: ABC-F family ATP-binding cassette domain-containing protein [Thermoanaerobaculia bacterium]